MDFKANPINMKEGVLGDPQVFRCLAHSDGLGPVAPYPRTSLVTVPESLCPSL